MRVFVTGATGFIGSAVVQELTRAGHQVLGLARSDASAALLMAAGAEVHRGTLDDLDSLTRGAAASDGVIHTAFVHDFSDIVASGRTDLLAIETIGAALAGSGRPFVVTSGLAHMKQGQVSTENDAADPDSPAKHRIPSEEATLALESRGIRASLIRLPPSVHGDGDYAFVPGLINIARTKGVSAYVGAGTNRWPAVHRLDAALLFRLALEKGGAGATFHGADEEGIPTRQIAEVIGRRLNIPSVTKSREEAGAHFGWLGHFFAMDMASSSTLTRDRLGWKPTHAGLIADLERGQYFDVKSS
jgi:nucleoside-diphosphate-sugar epimerase